MNSTTDSSQLRPEPLNVLIAGAGVAGLEAAFALAELAGDRVRTTLLAPGADFVLRPMAVGEPFSSSWAQRYPLARLASEAGAELVQGRLAAVDPIQRTVTTESGSTLPYDALLVASGAGQRVRFEHATTIDDAKMDELLHGLVQDIEGGYVGELAIVVPAPAPWPLPAYELALLCSERAWSMQAQLTVTVFTPEERPLAAFGLDASLALSRLLSERHIEVVTAAHCEVPQAKTIVVHPGGRTFTADSVIALPELLGPGLSGLPQEGGGFIPVDELCRVRSVEQVWAAGDGTDFPLKYGGVAAQMADTAARGIAAQVGAASAPEPFEPVLEAVLLTGGAPRYLRTEAADGQAADSEWVRLHHGEDRPKVAARYLTPHLTGDHPETVSA